MANRVNKQPSIFRQILGALICGSNSRVQKTRNLTTQSPTQAPSFQAASTSTAPLTSPDFSKFSPANMAALQRQINTHAAATEPLLPLQRERAALYGS